MQKGDKMRASLKVAIGVAVVLVIATVVVVSIMASTPGSGSEVVAPKSGDIHMWAVYISSNYDLGKTVLVGNVKDNPELKALWNVTGLPPSKSFLPNVIRKGNITFITGTSNNIYLTAEKLDVVFHPADEAIFVSVFLSIVIITVAALESRSAKIFYVVTAFTVGIWSLNMKPSFAPSALRVIYYALTRFGVILSPETAFYIHVCILLMISSMIFYMAPKRFRELGFVVMGYLLALPAFRCPVSKISPLDLGILMFVTTAAMVSNFTFSGGKRKIAVQIVGLSVFSAASILMQPWTAVIPLTFAVTFPRKKRNAVYIALTTAFVIIALRSGYRLWDLVEIKGGTMLNGFTALQLLLPAILIIYLALTCRIRLSSKGVTTFLMISSAVFGIGSIFSPCMVPYFLTGFTTTAIRVAGGKGKNPVRTLSPL